MDTFDEILKYSSKITLQSLGCKVNQSEIMELSKLLRTQGHEIVDEDGEPEVFIINTCTVTKKSDYQSRQLIRRAARQGAKVIVTGCYSELNRDAVQEMDNVIGVVDNGHKHLYLNMMHVDSECDTSTIEGSRTRHFLKVQDGCDNACSYCIIPRARGASKSLPMGEAVRQAGAAVQAGYKEIVLTGIHLGQYGSEMVPPVGLTALVRDILERTPVERLRLSSLEINEIDEGLISLFKDERIAGHMHVPLQSGDDRILGLMNRNYGSAYFKEKIVRISDSIGVGFGLGTDVIAGFPGETGREFKNTLKLIEELPFTYLHVFPYSERPGTVASTMDDKVDTAIIKERSRILRELGVKKKLAFMDRSVGKTLSVLLEEELEDEGTYAGTAANYLKVRASAKGAMRGKIAPVRVFGHDGTACFGRTIK